MRPWNWNGARWWMFDFHAHTPASDDYGKGSNQRTLKNHAPRQWLLDYMQAGIDCVAVTDHNTGAWIDQLKTALAEMEAEKPDGFRPIHLFPGVEISVNGGIHLLAILAPGKTTPDVDSLLGAVGFRGVKGTSNDVTTKSFAEVARAIEQAGGIAVPAHIEGEHGLFTLSGTTLAQALDCATVFAMEVVHSSSAKPPVYQQKNLSWSEVLGSDCHHPSGTAGERYPGSHFTWIKMGTPSLEGLHLALLDGPLSVRRSEQVIGHPNTHAPLVIESLVVSQARYMGRSSSFTLELNPWLNVLIGGRGTGKSTLVEFLRLTLRRKAELPEALAWDFKKYEKVYQSRDDDGLLTEQSAFSVTYRKDRTRFRVQWNQREDVKLIQVEDENGQWIDDEGDVAQRFPVRIYSQKQTFELAKTPLALLRIVDEAPEVDRRSWDDHWKEEGARFLSLRAKGREIAAVLADESRLRGELEDVKRRLAIFEEAGHANVLKEYQKRIRQQRGAEDWEKTWAGSGESLRSLAADLLPDPLDASLFEPDRVEDQDLLLMATASVTQLEAVCTRLANLAKETDSALTRWRKDRDESAWRLAVNVAIEEYDKLRQRLEDEKAGEPSVYGDLVQRRQILEARLKDLESRRKQFELFRSEADGSLKRLKKMRHELTEKRKVFLTTVLADNPYVRITVVPYGAREIVEPEIRRLLQREQGGFEKDIGNVEGEGLLGEIYRDPSNSDAVEERIEQLKGRVKNIATGAHDLNSLGDRRFAAHIGKLPPEVLDRLDIWFPEDSLQVQYSTTADGSGFRSIQEGSPGQKTAALLAFLFSYGDEPIILDQPEDDLDNHLIYDLIVGQLRRIKQRRQVIVVTHNANIVVNGDAELVVPLVARGGETHQDSAGCLQEKKVRDTICEIMEGGREAFEKRYRRIVLAGSRHV